MAGRRSSWITQGDIETQAAGLLFAQSLKEGCVVALLGDLGAGKTTFVKGIAEELGNCNCDLVTSPTFHYLNTYDTKPNIYHFDLYRLKQAEDFVHLGFLDYLESNDGICLIEWAEKIFDFLPKTTLYVNLIHLEEGKRQINVYKK